MLKRMTDEALQAELDRRKAERDEKAKPQPIAEPDWSTVGAIAIGHVAGLLRGEEAYIDEELLIYEKVIEAVYGAGIWSRLNKLYAQKRNMEEGVC